MNHISRSALFIGITLVTALIGVAVIFAGPHGSVSAEIGVPVDALWGDSLSPCEDIFGFDTELRVTIPLDQRERELVHLAMEGFSSDLEHEATGVGNAVPPFDLRNGFLNFFITNVVPSIQSRVAGRFEDEFPTPENEAAMKASIQNVEFGGCERTAVSIAVEHWNLKSGGQMAGHLKLCNASKEMKATSACQSFYPLGEAYHSLTKKIEKDQ